MGKRKYNTEEERIAARKEQNRLAQARWREKHPDYRKQQYEANKDYYDECHKKWVKDNPELNRKYHKNYYDRNRDKVLLREKKYRSTKNGKAKNLVGVYRHSDKLANRGECTITKEWMVDNVFSGQRCFYCGESDWTKLGLDRIDNSKHHTPDNVVVCCEECNKKRGRKSFKEFCKEMGVEQIKYV